LKAFLGGGGIMTVNIISMQCQTSFINLNLKYQEGQTAFHLPIIVKVSKELRDSICWLLPTHKITLNILTVPRVSDTLTSETQIHANKY